MMELKGKYGVAKIFTDLIEDTAKEQIEQSLNHPAFENVNMRIMPDVHAGAGNVIGTTLKHNGKIIPNLVGVDIGCGMLTVELGHVGDQINFQFLDDFIKQNIPHGVGKINEDCDHFSHVLPILQQRIESICSKIIKIDPDKSLRAIGSLGSGNHFIEVNVDDSGCYYLIIHSGSRGFGYQVAAFHQHLAKKLCKENGIDTDKSLAYLEGIHANNYLHDAGVAVLFANVSRVVMADRIIQYLFGKGYQYYDYFETVHNYISPEGYIRKGAVSAKKGERLLIPINMKDGSLLCEGLGNKDWNYSAPHGAGRLMSRTKAKKNLSLEDFKDSMKDVWTSSVSEKTLDEAPRAYKDINNILDNIKPTAKVKSILKPVYNFKG